ncbi:styrene monooxygenase NADH-dependent flavin reductase subunit StyB [Burkholderia multivorans]|uniref:styrene monooxygenase NADH-dependent flavin reductase subunit StyB n=1 Tax=Burkholderia multivorans TaxID=87883 RepID=UPI00201A1814|nr:flavin reductase family protein [Burkholderia multivorans]MCO1367061.1 flavin reductase family protein [Burkholderia multivorans]MCO1376670.1 flavin reductase family protein [Burkholderia multivorans]UQP18622.1 flavin reductase family protein [Burkholderia multivorans]UQP86591.1 flavin reductase family protein [Burkholderia multivorans]
MINTEVAQRRVTADERSQFRKSISLFATGIAIVSVDAESAGEVHGATINSFTSISLDPPTIMISLKPGRTHRLISDQGCFGISILHDEQESYSALFSGRVESDCKPEFVVPSRVPVLRSALAWFECDVTERVEMCDHTLFFARVVACDGSAGSPLVFYASRYHKQPSWA